MDLTTEAKKAIAQWFGEYNKGPDSIALAVTALTGFAPSDPHFPTSPFDFSLCVRLIERAPEIRTIAFPVLAEASSGWARMIEQWDTIAATMEEEVGIRWTKGKSAPKTYAVMEPIIKAITEERFSTPEADDMTP